MRYLRQDKSVFTDATVGKVDLVDLRSVADANRRDLWIRCVGAGSNKASYYAFKTQDEANADPIDTSTAVATAVEQSGDGTLKTITFSNATESPDMSGLEIRAWLSATVADDHNETWAYVASPAEIILPAIYSILSEYMGSGQALENFTSTRNLQGADFWTSNNRILSAWTGEESMPESHDSMGVAVNFSVEVAISGIGERGQDTYKAVLGHAATLRSILGDERRRLDGVGAVTAVERLAEPYLKTTGEQEEDPSFIASRIDGVIEIPAMRSDRGDY